MEIKTLLLNWEQHVLSWSKQGLSVPKLILRYEDLVYNKKIVFVCPLPTHAETNTAREGIFGSMTKNLHYHK